MGRSSNGRLSEAEREQRRLADRERFKQAVSSLLTSDGWRRWVRVRAHGGMSRYSVNNQLLIALQRPDASFVAGFHAWKQFGYRVRKGEKGIRILAPITLKDSDHDTDDERRAGEDADRRRVVFRTVAVFDRVQVDAIPGREQLPLSPPSVPLTGNSHAHLLTPLENFAAELGYSIRVLPLDGAADGWCDSERMEIVVNESLAANAQVRVLVHEFAHALGIGYREFGRDRAEVIVDTATFIVCSSVGLDTAGESIPYVAGWGEDGALDAVTEFATTIDTVAKRLEQVLASDQPHAPALDTQDGDSDPLALTAVSATV